MPAESTTDALVAAGVRTYVPNYAPKPVVFDRGEGFPSVGPRRARVRRSRHRDQRQFVRPPASGTARGGGRSDEPALARQQPLLRGVHRAARGGAGGRDLRGTGVLLQLGRGGQRGGRQGGAQTCERGRPGARRARDHHLRGFVPRPHPGDGDRDRAAEVPGGLRAAAGRLHLLPVQRFAGTRSRGLRSDVRGHAWSRYRAREG